MIRVSPPRALCDDPRGELGARHGRPGRGPNRGRVCHGFELPFVFRNPVTLTLPPVQHRFTPAEMGAFRDALTEVLDISSAAGDVK